MVPVHCKQFMDNSFMDKGTNAPCRSVLSPMMDYNFVTRWTLYGFCDVSS